MDDDLKGVLRVFLIVSIISASLSLAQRLVGVAGGIAGDLHAVPSFNPGTLPRPVTGSDIEQRLEQQNVFGVGDTRKRLHCQNATTPWNFVCTFEPTPRTSTTRVKFGVRADTNGVPLEESTLTPSDADLPAPKRLSGL